MNTANDRPQTQEAHPLWKAQRYYGDEGWQDLAGQPLRAERLETLYFARLTTVWAPVRAVRMEETRESIAEESPSTDAATRIACSMVDIAIVGAGPAGLKAALEAGIDGFNTTFIDSDIAVGGQPKFSSTLPPDWPYQSGREIALNALANAVAWGAKPYLGVSVTSLAYDAQTGIKTLTLSDGQKIQALAVIIATGKSFRKMQFPGSDSTSVSYVNEERLSEQGADKFVAVVGGSDFAGNAALGAARTAKHVYLLSPIKRNADDSWAGRMAGTTEGRVRVHEKITVVEGDEIGSLRLDEQGNAVSLLTKGGKEIPCNGLGIFVGSAANAE